MKNNSQDLQFIQLPNGQKFYPTDPKQLGSARFLINEIFHKKFYERAGFELKPSDTVVDIGANMGLFAMWASTQVGQGQVLSIEPTSNCFATIIENISRNELKNIIPLQIALGAEECMLELLEYPGFNAVTHAAHLKPAAWGQFFIKLLYRKYSEPPNRLEVPCQTLEKVINEQELQIIDLLKIDCEGAEYDILLSTPDEVLKRVQRIVMEFHELDRSHSHHELVDRLQSVGFEVTLKKPWFDYWFLKTGTIWAIRL